MFLTKLLSFLHHSMCEPKTSHNPLSYYDEGLRVRSSRPRYKGRGRSQKTFFGPSDLSLVYIYGGGGGGGGGAASSPGSATEDSGVSIRSFTVPKSTFLVVFEQKLKAVLYCT